MPRLAEEALALALWPLNKHGCLFAAFEQERTYLGIRGIWDLSVSFKEVESAKAAPRIPRDPLGVARHSRRWWRSPGKRGGEKGFGWTRRLFRYR